MAELTRALPASIQFSLPPDAATPPMYSAPVSGSTYVIETFAMQADLKQLLDWADVHAVELLGLSAAPTRLDDVFRAVGTEPSTS